MAGSLREAQLTAGWAGCLGRLGWSGPKGPEWDKSFATEQWANTTIIFWPGITPLVGHTGGLIRRSK